MMAWDGTACIRCFTSSCKEVPHVVTIPGDSRISLPTRAGVVVCGLVLGGCSASDAPVPSVVPQAVAVPAARRVPIVIPAPRPFRIAQLQGPRRAAVRETASGQRPMPVPRERDPDDGIRLTADTTAVDEGMTAAHLLSSDAPPHSRPDADAGIRQALRDYLEAFNLHDAAALASHWTPDGTSVDLASGTVTSGREAVRSVLAALFEEDGSAAIDIDVGSVRQIRDDVALVDGVTRLSFATGDTTDSRFSAVMVREGDRWRLERMQEAPLESAETPARGSPLDALSWLLGSWEDVGEGVTAGTQCFWSGGRSFLVRTHVTTPDHRPEAGPEAGDDRIPGLLPAGPAAPLELTEIIGWDPDREEIRSWFFTSAGRFAEGSWRREGTTWKVHVVGQGRDTGLACVCTLTPQGGDAVAVRHDTDALAHLLPPACDFVRTSR
jgi:uncharacterized protein (TIGR02246 family)